MPKKKPQPDEVIDGEVVDVAPSGIKHKNHTEDKPHGNSTFDKAIADEFLIRVMMGESVRTICNDPSMPDKSTVFRWMIKDQEFRDQYARAKEEATDFLVEEIIEIADDSSQDYLTKVDQHGNEYEVVNNEVVQRSRLRVDTRKRIASKLKPKKYGEPGLLGLNNNDKVSIQVIKIGQVNNIDTK